MNGLLSVLLTTTLLGGGDPAPQDTVKVGDAVPPFTFVTTEEKEWNLADQKGKVVLINYFSLT